MREIKFRAWNSDFKEIASHEDLLKMAQEWSMLNVSPNIMLLPVKQPHIALMQYTGLKDKNEVEVYEGDILETWHKEYEEDKKDFKGDLVVVKYHEYEGNMLHYIFDICGVSNNVDDIRAITNYLVIGNIYENPELVE